MVDSTWNRLNLMMQQGNLRPVERCNLILNSALDVLSMELGCLTRLDDDCMSMVFSTNKKWKDIQYNVYQSPCRFAIDEGDVIAFHNLQYTNWDELGVIEPLRFGAYIGLPIHIDKKVYGTLFFASYSARAEDFSARDQAYLKMIASSFRMFIQKELMEA